MKVFEKSSIQRLEKDNVSLRQTILDRPASECGLERRGFEELWTIPKDMSDKLLAFSFASLRVDIIFLRQTLLSWETLIYIFFLQTSAVIL